MADFNIESHAVPVPVPVNRMMRVTGHNNRGRVAETSTRANPKVARRHTSLSAKDDLVCLRLDLLFLLVLFLRIVSAILMSRVQTMRSKYFSVMAKHSSALLPKR